MRKIKTMRIFSSKLIRIIILLFIIINAKAYSQTSPVYLYVDSLFKKLERSQALFDSGCVYMNTMNVETSYEFSTTNLTKAKAFIDSAFKMIPAIDSVYKIKFCKDAYIDHEKFKKEYGNNSTGDIYADYEVLIQEILLLQERINIALDIQILYLKPEAARTWGVIRPIYTLNDPEYVLMKGGKETYLGFLQSMAECRELAKLCNM